MSDPYRAKTTAEERAHLRRELQLSISISPDDEQLLSRVFSDLEAAEARVATVEKAARAVLVAADKSVGIARLSDDELSWICPECSMAGDCHPACKRGALLGALDSLEALLAPGVLAAKEEVDEEQRQ